MLYDKIPDWMGYETIRRLKKLEENAGTLPVLFALFFQHGISSFVVDVSNSAMSFGIPLTHWLGNFIVAAIVAYIYINNATAVDVFNTANEVKEKVGGEKDKQTTFDEY